MIGRTYLERGRPVIVLARWSGGGPRNVLVEREDGCRVVRPFRGLRRADRVSAAPAPHPLNGKLVSTRNVDIVAVHYAIRRWQ